MKLKIKRAITFVLAVTMVGIPAIVYASSGGLSLDSIGRFEYGSDKDGKPAVVLDAGDANALKQSIENNATNIADIQNKYYQLQNSLKQNDENTRIMVAAAGGEAAGYTHSLSGGNGGGLTGGSGGGSTYRCGSYATIYGGTQTGTICSSDGVSIATNCGNLSNDYSGFTVYAKDLPIHAQPYPMDTTQAVSSDKNIIIDGTCYNGEYQDIMMYWDRIPQNIKDSYFAAGGKIVITDDLQRTTGIRVDYPTASIYGFYDPKTHEIDIDWSWWYNHDTICHEMGHYVDNVMGRPSQTPVFTALFKKYRQVSAYSGESQKEYFAQSFANVINEPEKYAKEKPDLYAAIMNTIADFGTVNYTSGLNVSQSKLLNNK